MKVALVCLAPLRNDSRVLRHARLLVEAGHDVVIFAEAPLPADEPCKVVVIGQPKSDLHIRAELLLRQGPAALWRGLAMPLYWACPDRQRAAKALADFAPDLVIANDWKSLPLAASIQEQCGTPFIYDSHEFATQEFWDSRLWRIVARPHVVEVERRHIGRAAAVMTVSRKLAEALHRHYGLARIPTVIANMPAQQQSTFRPTGETITVLYHGVVAPRRGLEILVESAAFWPPHLELLIRGESAGTFTASLERQAMANGARVRFEPAVDPAEVVRSAATADIGVFLFSDSSGQGQVVLPNKIFEYIAAGLMVLSSDLPEIRAVMEKTGAGLLLPDMNAPTIAAVLASQSRAQIDAFKKASLKAADWLNFGGEAERLLKLVDQVCATRSVG